MKKRIRHITYSWIVLICFVAGQLTAFSHQHPADLKSHLTLAQHATSQQTIKEKCYVCDAMHHTHMAMFTDATPALYVTVVNAQYIREHDYKGIALILSAGRSPPRDMI